MLTIGFQGALQIFLMAAPWLFFSTFGPSPGVVSWLGSACCLVALIGFSGPLRFGNVRLAWAVAAVLSSVLAVVQYFGFAQMFAPWLSASLAGEAFANLRQRNQFASLTSIGLVALLALLTSKQQKVLASTPALAWPFVHVGIVMLALGNAASSSRTGMLQWLLVSFLALWWARHQVHLIAKSVALTLGVYGLAVLAMPEVLALTSSVQIDGLLNRLTHPQGCSSRTVLWSNVLTLIAQKPWFGWGWGELDYAHYITRYDGPRFCDILDNAHNLPLHLAVELGIPFALLVCGGFGWWVWRQAPWREADPTRQLAWGVMAVILLHSMLEYPLWYGPFQMAFGLCMWMLWRRDATLPSLAPTPPQDGSTTHANQVLNKPLAKALRAMFASISIAAIAYTAWDYHRISQIYLPPESRDAGYREDTLGKIQRTRLFANQVRFAELGLTPLTPGNAQWTFDTASALLHFSPEPRVIEKVIESAVMLGRDSDALIHLERYRAVFPEAYAQWAASKPASAAGTALGLSVRPER